MNYQEWKETGKMKLSSEDINDPGTMLVVQNEMNKQHESWDKQIQTIIDVLNISYNYASSIWYLRQRSRWTQELENRLVQMARDGEECPNIMDFP